ncbi:MAG: exodeoxyribonuclease V subunit gamma, partial [Chitinivibrionales bacterium]|nr:exodeoxyribonuclease V subunit gamma [Chitinivibrionales bacterium]
MLHLNFAPSSDLLVPVLMAALRKAWRDPFAAPAVIVPSPAVGKWLRMRLADNAILGKQEGAAPFECVANLPMPTLEHFLWNALAPDAALRLLTVEHLQQVVCALLDEERIREDSYQPIHAYLVSPIDGKIDPRKRVQLSIKIARQFLEYEYNRPSVWDDRNRRWGSPGIDATWLAGKNYCGNEAEHEAWQKDLYCKAQERLRAGPEKNAIISLPHLYRRRRENGLNGGPWSVAPCEIMLFQASKISHFHRNTLVEISQMDGVEMHIFLTNPCAEFWEDLDTWRNHKYPRRWKHDSPAQSAGVSSRKPEDYNTGELEDFAHLPDDPVLLELWGRAGKENIYLWCPQAAWNFEYYCPAWVEKEQPPQTLLKALQLSLLRRESKLPLPASGQPWESDG